MDQLDPYGPAEVTFKLAFILLNLSKESLHKHI